MFVTLVFVKMKEGLVLKLWTAQVGPCMFLLRTFLKARGHPRRFEPASIVFGHFLQGSIIKRLLLCEHGLFELCSLL